MNTFQATVSALCYSIIRERCSARAEFDPACNRVVDFVLAQHRRMPDFLRLPMTCATIAFGCESWLRGRGRFFRHDHPARWQQIQRWRQSRLGPQRDLIKFYESLAVFGWYAEQAEGADA